MTGSLLVPELTWRNGTATSGERDLAEETAVAIIYNELPYAVMMASPLDFDDFAIGFTLTEGLAADLDEINSCAAVMHELGIEMRLVLARPALERVLQRRRRVAGYTGCGVCGLESLEQVMRPLPAPGASQETPAKISASALRAAFAGLEARQHLNNKTRAVHAAAFWSPETGLGPVREDVGRHNAFDKLIGALAQAGVDPAGGFVLLTARCSFELVQKAVIANIPVLATISAASTMAVDQARAHGLTLYSLAREDSLLES